LCRSRGTTQRLAHAHRHDQARSERERGDEPHGSGEAERVGRDAGDEGAERVAEVAPEPYLPLAGFVIPTVVIGYGFVIPRSCIAGVNELTLEAEAFDRIYSVHCIYFWNDPDRVFGQLAAALRPGGRLVLAFRPEGPSVPARFRDPTYRFYAPEDVIARLARVGLSSEVSKPSDDVVWIVAERP
jgi:SAM-dependent methyltransferase